MKIRLRFSPLFSVLAMAAGCLFSGQAKAQSYICFNSTSTNLTPTLGAACTGRAGGPIYSFSLGVSAGFNPVTGITGKTSASSFSYLTPTTINEFYNLEYLLTAREPSTVAIGFNSTKPGPNGTTVPYNITLLLTKVSVESVETSGSGGGGLVDSVSLHYQTIEVVDNSTTPATTYTYTNPN